MDRALRYAVSRPAVGLGTLAAALVPGFFVEQVLPPVAAFRGVYLALSVATNGDFVFVTLRANPAPREIEQKFVRVS